MKSVIHIHQEKLKKGEPCIIVRTYKGSEHYREVSIEGPSKVVWSDTPDRCGARAWVETHAPVVGVK